MLREKEMLSVSCVPAAAIRLYPEGIAPMKKFWIALGVLLAVLTRGATRDIGRF